MASETKTLEKIVVVDVREQASGMIDLLRKE